MSHTTDPLTDARLQGFDADWYTKTYPDVALSGMDAAQHYLTFGLQFGRAKGPVANVEPVLSRSPKDVAALFGKSAPPVTSQRNDLSHGPVIATPTDLIMEHVTKQDVPARGPNIGVPELLLGETEIGRSYSAPALWALAGPVRMLGRLVGATDTLSCVPEMDVHTPIDELSLDNFVSPLFLNGPTQIQNAWFSSTATLHFALAGHDDSVHDGAVSVLRAWQADPQEPGHVISVGEYVLPQKGPGFFDLALINPLMPVLIEVSDIDGFSQGFAILAFPSLLRGGFHATERAAHQLGPDPMSEVWRLSTALLQEILAGPRDSEFAIARLAVRYDIATGAEPIFSNLVRDWLQAIFGLELTQSDTCQDSSEPGAVWLKESLTDAHLTTAVRGKGLTLDLPPLAIPTLQALASRRMTIPQDLNQATGPFLVGDAISMRPLCSVSMPLTDQISPDLPILIQEICTETAHDANHVPPHWLAPLHLAVIYRPSGPVSDIQTLFPIAPDAPYVPQLSAPMAVSVVVTASDPDLIARVLSSLKYQHEIQVSEVVLKPASWAVPDRLEAVVAVAEQVFPNRVCMGVKSTNSPNDLDQIRNETQAETILLLDEAVVLQDPRIFSTLAAELSADDAISSVSCALMHEDLLGKSTVLQFGSAGLFPAGVSLMSAPRLTVIEPNILKALPATTYPVLANTFSVCLVRRAALDATADTRLGFVGTGAADLHFGLSTNAKGWRNLCTSIARAGTTRPPSGRDEIDPFGLSCIHPSSWDQLLNTVTILQELRG